MQLRFSLNNVILACKLIVSRVGGNEDRGHERSARNVAGVACL